MGTEAKLYNGLIILFASTFLLVLSLLWFRVLPDRPSFLMVISFLAYAAVLLVIIYCSFRNRSAGQLLDRPTVLQIVYLLSTGVGLPVAIWGIVLLIKREPNSCEVKRDDEGRLHDACVQPNGRKSLMGGRCVFIAAAVFLLAYCAGYILCRQHQELILRQTWNSGRNHYWIERGDAEEAVGYHFLVGAAPIEGDDAYNQAVDEFWHLYGIVKWRRVVIGMAYFPLRCVESMAWWLIEPKHVPWMGGGRVSGHEMLMPDSSADSDYVNDNELWRSDSPSSILSKEGDRSSATHGPAP